MAGAYKLGQSHDRTGTGRLVVPLPDDGEGLKLAARTFQGCDAAFLLRWLKKRSRSMSAYTVSHLANDAGVSAHAVRDYMLRGLLRPVKRTAGGYVLFVLVIHGLLLYRRI